MGNNMKKGDSNIILAVIIGIIITIIAILAVRSYPEGLFKILMGSNEENIHSEQQFAVFVDKLKIAEEGKAYNMLYGVGKEYSLIAFPKGKEKIGNENCKEILNGGKGFNLGKEIIKPRNKECSEKSCFCLCKGGLESGSCGESENALCYGFDFEVKDIGNNCGYCLMEGYEFGNVYFKRDKGTMYVGRIQLS